MPKLLALAGLGPIHRLCSWVGAFVLGWPRVPAALPRGCAGSFLLCHCQPSSLPSQGPNSVFEVYLVGNNSNHFIISPTSIQGKADIRVRVAVPLDFETIPRYEFSVRLHPCALWDVHIFERNLRVTINEASLFLSLIHTMKLRSITKWPKNGNSNKGKGGGGEEICSAPSLSFQHPKAQLQELKQSVFPLAMSQGRKSFIEHKTLF